MIIVLVRVESSSADISALRDMLAEMETKTRAEAGCHDYSFCQELTDPDCIRVIERWESMDALVEHFATPHMAAFNAALADRPPRSMNLEIRELGAELSLPG